MKREEIIQAIAEDKLMPFIQPGQLAGIVDFVLDSYTPSFPSNLDEAAIDAAQLDMQDRQIMEATNDERLRYSRIFRRGFKAGAEWLAGQGQTLDSLIWRDEDDKLFIEVFVDENKFKMAENVTIQIRKKQ